ncbi:Hypothetical predicted protein [Podarcis lilfordi]|uniref:Uncharacterized protein n=1 Tax=Podarcis lilfordi TaxID=74358 RepID=A0AA35PIW0_9SAUR|nr:Hypothetical predicted protein [Podarcis lilfordi]
MALSGASQSHVQPVWAEIPSRSADIGAQAVPSRVPIRTQLKTIIYKSVYRRILEEGEGDPSNLSALPAQNLLADPFNSGHLSSYISLQGKKLLWFIRKDAGLLVDNIVDTLKHLSVPARPEPAPGPRQLPNAEPKHADGLIAVRC